MRLVPRLLAAALGASPSSSSSSVAAVLLRLTPRGEGEAEEPSELGLTNDPSLSLDEPLTGEDSA
jgi:hypothetical protein